MSTNVSKQKRDNLLNKIQALRAYISAAEQDENTTQLLTYLSDLANDVDGKKYGLIFEEHHEEIDEVLDTHMPVLTEDTDLFIDNGEQMNFLIEGDNLASLKILEKTHRNSVDFIYIDPPYNTGSNSFIYDDDFVSKDDAFLHSKWLSFMEKRLKIAKNVLREDGCILISINENEVFNLKLLCDDIFGAENYLTNFAVKVRHEDRILKGDKDFHEVFEYMLFYRKSHKHKTSKRVQDNTSNDEYVWTLKEIAQPFEILQMGNKRVEVFRPQDYEIKKVAPDESNFKKISIRGSIKEGNSSGRFFMKYLNQYIGKNLGFLYKVEKMGDDGIGYRYFIIPNDLKRKNGDYLQGVPINRKDTKEVPYANLLDFEASFNNVGREGEVEFRNGKKPIAFLKHCFDMGGLCDGRKTVLDFFAGSGSTGHALLDYNREHNLKHRFILCTNNQNNICRGVTYERIKRVIDKEDYDASLKYYKVDYIPISEHMYYEYADKLLSHIRELVELENGINFTGNAEIAIVLTDEELAEFVNGITDETVCHKLYIKHDVLLNEEQQEKLFSHGINICIIPDYYYSDLQE